MMARIGLFLNVSGDSLLPEGNKSHTIIQLCHSFIAKLRYITKCMPIENELKIGVEFYMIFPPYQVPI